MSLLFWGPRVSRPSDGFVMVWGPLSSKANPSYVGSQSPLAIPPFSDLVEDSKEEQELVILRTASTANWHASACDFSFGNAPGELPFLFGNEGPFAPFFSGVPLGSSLAGIVGGIKVSAGDCSSSLSRDALLHPYLWLLGLSMLFFLPVCFCQTVPAKIQSALPWLTRGSPGVGAVCDL